MLTKFLFKMLLAILVLCVVVFVGLLLFDPGVVIDVPAPILFCLGFVGIALFVVSLKTGNAHTHTVSNAIQVRQVTAGLSSN